MKTLLGIILFALFIIIAISYTGAYTDDPYLECLIRQNENREYRVYRLRIRATLFDDNMNGAYDMLCTPLDYGIPSNDSFYEYDRLGVGE